MANEQQGQRIPEEVKNELNEIVQDDVAESMPHIRRRRAIGATLTSIAADAGIETVDIASANRTHESPLIVHSPVFQLLVLALPWAITFGTNTIANRRTERIMRENGQKYAEHRYEEQQNRPQQ